MLNTDCSTLQLAKQFCEEDFIKRNAQEAIALCAKNITWFGTGANEDVIGIEEASHYIESEIAENLKPYRIEYISEQEQITIAPTGVAMVKMKLSNAALMMECRLTVTTIVENDGDCNLEDRLLNVGAADFIYKPSSPQIVQTRLHNALRKYGKY